MRITAKTDYALRAAVELAARDGGRPANAELLAARQDVPLRFLENILPLLRRAGIVESRRGRSGGWALARPPAEISLAEVVRAVDGPLAGVAGVRPHDLSYRGPATAYREVWVAVRANVRAVLERVTLADVAAGRLPPEVALLAEDPDAWATR